MKLGNLFGKVKSAPISLVEKIGAGVRTLRMSYDGAQTTILNANHWLPADHLSADAANSEAVRKILRERTRYEVASNEYAHGNVDTRANDVVGRGPRIQIRSGDDEVDNFIESEFKKWAKKNKLPRKLRLIRKARLCSGEGFILFANGAPTKKNPFDLNERPSGVPLTLRLIEADQVATPGMMLAEQTGQVSGIVFDKYGKPSHYHILKKHPGDQDASSISQDDKFNVPAEDIIHYFKPERPGQSRGIPELTPALQTIPQHRRWDLATLTAAENLANIAMVIQTTSPADGEAAAVETMESIPMVQGEALILPDGWTLGQAKAEQPVATHSEYSKSIIKRFARCISTPFNVASGDSSEYNYASGRLDHQGYHKVIGIEQSEMEDEILDRTFWRWFDQAVALSGYLPQKAREVSFANKIEVSWFWDGTEHVDPLKEANAQKVRLSSHTTTLAIECARSGYDWKDMVKQRKAERIALEEAGLLQAGTQIKEEPSDSNDNAPKRNGKSNANA